MKSSGTRISALLGTACAAAAAVSMAVSQALAAGAPPAEIVIPGERLITESLTSSSDGTVYVGSVVGRTIYRAKPGSGTAEAWIQPGTDGMSGVFGVLADEKAGTLWACSGNFGPPAPNAPPSRLHAFDLKSGTPKGKWDVPTAGGFCNDIAVGSDGTAYISDTNNMEIAALKRGGKALELWAGNGAFGPKGGVLDGIAVLGDKVLVNALATSKLFVVPIGKDGKAGTAAEVKLDRAIERPDGQRSFGKSSLLVVEGGGGGRLSRVDLAGANLDSGKVTTLKEGFPDGPVAVTVVGDMAYVLEGQLSLVMGPPPAAGAPPRASKPFKATGVKVGRP